MEGRVASGGIGLPDVTVFAYTSTGDFAGSTFTDPLGNYAIPGLAGGTYFARTGNAGPYINEAWDNLVCLSCNISASTPIAVPATGAVTGIDFDLALGARITGTITDGVPTPIGGIGIRVTNAGNTSLDNVTTLADGTYATEAFPPGTYYVRTFNRLGYVNEIYPDIPCLSTCSTASATGVAITGTTDATGIDFSLALGARIAGTVTDAVTGAPLPLVWVTVYDGSGRGLTSGLTDSGGAYISEDGLPTGTYFVRTFNTAGHLDQFWNGRPCVGFCSPVTTGTPIPVVAPAVVGDKDFALSVGGRIAGTVREQGTLAAIPGVDVDVRTADGARITSGFTDASGGYASDAGLPAGIYFVTLSNNAGYLNELFDDVPCAGSFCPVAGGTPVVVAAGATTAGVDFLVERGARVSGTVTDAGGAPLAGVSVSLLSATGATFSTASTTSAGVFITGAGLPAASYFVQTSNQLGYINERYDDVPCVGTLCPTSGGTSVTVTPPGSTSGVAIALAAGGRIAGTVTSHDGSPIPGVWMPVFDTGGRFVASGFTDSLGRYVTDAGLPSGTYFVKTSNSDGYIDELYPNLACPFFDCAPTNGGPVIVTLPSTTSGIDFQLEVGGRVTGTVTRAAGAVPLPGIRVTVLDANGSSVASAQTNGLGQYTAVGLAAGTYYARTSNTQGYINELYDDIPCPLTCQGNTGNPFVVALGATTSGIDFALADGGRIAGQVTSGGSPINGVTVRILNAAGTTVATAITGLTGTYVTPNGLAAGTYFARTSNDQGYINEEYDDLRCVGSCTVGLGAPIVVAAGSTTSGIDFALTAGGRVSGAVTDAASGVGVPFVSIIILDSSGRTVSSGFTDETSTYVTADGLPTDLYYARTLNSSGYVDEAYPDTKCLRSCPAVSGTPFAVTEGVVTPGIDFALAAGGRIEGRIIDSATGDPLPSVNVSIHDASGRFVATGVVNESGFWASKVGLPAGTYFARTTNSSGYVNELYGGAPCVGGCVVTSGTPIAVVGTATTTGIDFALARGGRLGGTVTSAATGLPASGVAVRVDDATGAFVTSVTTDFTGRYLTRDGLPTGGYRARTVNTVGFVDQLYNGLPCVGTCNTSAGTSIAVTAGAITSGIDFALSAGGRISGVITRAAGGAPLANVTVSLHDASATRVATATTDGLGAYLTGAGVPAGTYFARTENTFGYVNEVFDNIACVLSCSPTSGTPITVSAGAVTGGVSFALDLDVDPDGDGIVSSIDKNQVTGADESATSSNDFNDGPVGGSTAGTTAVRSGWTVTVIDRSPGGVEARVNGSGSGAARFDTCAAGGPEAVLLDVSGESATIACAGNTTTAAAIVATPTIQLREPPTGPGTVVDLTSGQAASLGSPVVAASSNTQPIGVRFVDAAGATFGSLQLDPGESIDAAVPAAGTVSVQVLSGVVTVEVNGESVTLSAGHDHTFGDVTAPQLYCAATPSVLWPPDHKLVPVTVTVALVDGESGPAGFVLTSAGSSEPADPRRGADIVGFVVGAPSTSGALRASRSGRGPTPRVYTLVYTGEDKAGNRSSCTVTVKVSHHRRR
jgi:hypothetical protein